MFCVFCCPTRKMVPLGPPTVNRNRRKMKKGLKIHTNLHISDEFRRKFLFLIFAFPCIILLNFAVNFAKHYITKTKPQNDHKNGLKWAKKAQILVQR